MISHPWEAINHFYVLKSLQLSTYGIRVGVWSKTTFKNMFFCWTNIIVFRKTKIENEKGIKPDSIFIHSQTGPKRTQYEGITKLNQNHSFCFSPIEHNCFKKREVGVIPNGGHLYIVFTHCFERRGPLPRHFNLSLSLSLSLAFWIKRRKNGTQSFSLMKWIEIQKRVKAIIFIHESV